MSLSVTEVVNALLQSDELYCPFDQSGVAVAGATNAVNTRKREAVTVSLFFHPVTPTLLTSLPPPTGILYSSQFRLHQETKMAAHQTQRLTSTISRKNRGLWTV